MSDEPDIQVGSSAPTFTIASLEVKVNSSLRSWEGKYQYDSDGDVEDEFSDTEGLPSVRLIRIRGDSSTAGSQLAAAFASVQQTGDEDALYELLRRTEPRLKRFLIWTDSSQSALHADLGNGLVLPLPLVSDGFARVTASALNVYRAENGVVTIDEIENGIHVSILGEYWRALYELAVQYNVQVFATTHSAECVQAAARVIPPDQLLLHRLHRVRGDSAVQTFDSTMLSAAIDADLSYR